MKYGLNNKTIGKIVGIFYNNKEIEQAILFGSRAKGNYRPSSDIDITLKGDISFDNLLRIESQLDNLMLPYKFDVTVFEKLKNQDLINHIDRVGKIFYQKQ
ncbi:nucleotidyltransferase domain-containing protein [Aureibaculum sp. 2210JD6-5]|uniref:nucleotidyltransferase domain-containing protein n=1 Tax=Aureibaculum sp. 2210JD6-5 TaxID=3103957 RepID=UPI002AAD9833|nr:nucleotidyltransferase domain-containing protein [Aureibaculum sp. 2210JD6-5]MDY7394074.1 nucleotidyltransferase domain-containing protein [Aureibaculum sp. 2210JD6-5]